MSNSELNNTNIQLNVIPNNKQKIVIEVISSAFVLYSISHIINILKNKSTLTEKKITSIKPNKKIKLFPLSKVQDGKHLNFNVPRTKSPAIIFNLGKNKLVAYDIICPHQGCTVGYSSGPLLICPCHGSKFEVTTGKVVSGPAQSSLTKLNVEIGKDKNIYLNQKLPISKNYKPILKNCNNCPCNDKCKEYDF